MAVFKEGLKALLRTFKEWAPGIARWGGESAKGAVKFGFKHPVVAAVVVGAAAQKDGEGVLNYWGRKLGGSDFQSKGLGDKAKELAFGKESEDKSMLGAGYDFVAGKGASEELGNQIAQMGEKVREKFGDARDAVEEQFYGNGVMSASQQVPQQFDQSYLRYADYPLNASVDSGQLGQGSQGFLGNMQNFISNLFGNKNATMGTVAVATAAWLLFGRFGWLGKVGGVLSGYWGLNRMRDGLGQAYFQQMGVGQRVLTPEENYRLQEQQMREEEKRQTTVNRGKDRGYGLKFT